MKRLSVDLMIVAVRYERGGLLTCWFAVRDIIVGRDSVGVLYVDVVQG